MYSEGNQIVGFQTSFCRICIRKDVILLLEKFYLLLIHYIDFCWKLNLNIKLDGVSMITLFVYSNKKTNIKYGNRIWLAYIYCFSSIVLFQLGLYFFIQLVCVCVLLVIFFCIFFHSINLKIYPVMDWI